MEIAEGHRPVKSRETLRHGDERLELNAILKATELAVDTCQPSSTFDNETMKETAILLLN